MHVGRRGRAAALTLVLAGLLLGAALASLGWWSRWPETQPRPSNRFAYAIPASQSLRYVNRGALALSPDGRRFVYNSEEGLYLRDMSELEARPIPDTQGVSGMLTPVFSPDGQSLAFGAFLTGRTPALVRIGVGGGAPVVLTNEITDVYGADWSEDDTILYADDNGIHRVSGNGGTPALVIEGESNRILASPQLLPDGDTLLYSATVAQANASAWSDEDAEVVLGSLTTGDRKVLLQGASDARYVPTGHLLYARGDVLFAVPFDLATKTVVGGAVPVVQNVRRGERSGTANYAVGKDGTLAYLSGGGSPGRRLLWIDRDGREEPIDAPVRAYMYAALSPDGTRVALAVRDQENDIWIWDLNRATLQRLTFDPGLNRGVAWSPDGRVAFSREIEGREEIYLQAADGFGRAEQLTINSGGVGGGGVVRVVPDDFTPDGKLIYQTGFYPRDIRITSIGQAEPLEGAPLLATAADEGAAALSPNGRWLAYHSDESGQWEIYVRPYPDVDSGRRQVSTNGGVHPLWSRDGKELFYLDLGGGTQGRGDLYAVPVETADSLQAGVPSKLIANVFVGGNYKHPYDVSPDGRRFLMIREVEATEPARIVIVQNWFDELERLAPTK